jgi:hypothetical protein
MINNINTYSNLFNSNSSILSTASGIDDVIAKNKETTLDQTVGDNANLYLSSRAQKIDSLSREFFSQGEISFSDVDALKERAYELGLISKQDYSRLSDLPSQSIDAAEEFPTQTLVNVIGEFLSRIEEAEKEKVESIDKENTTDDSNIMPLLKDALLTAKGILSDVDKAKAEPDFKESLANTLTLLKDTINADFFDQIPLDDKVGLTRTYQALDIVDKISPQRLNNEKLNRYIDIGLA